MAPGAAAAKAAAAPAAPAAQPKAAAAPAAPAQPAAPEPEKPAVGVVTDHDPTPSGTTPSKAAVPKPATGGNVWATKGSAAIINAAKPKPKPVPVAPQDSIKPKVPEPAVEETKEEMPAVPPSPVAPSADASAAQEVGLPASVAGANINAAGWTPSADAPVAQPSPVVGPADTSSVASAKIPPSPKLPPAGAPPRAPAAQQKPANVLNLGQWDTNDGDENQSIDFAFGSFGQAEGGDDATTASKASAPAATEALPSKITKAEAPATAGVSPTRPPPGLGGMMPPMPTEGVVNVQDLEAKLDSSSLAPKTEAAPAPAPPKTEAEAAPAQPQQQIPQGYGAPAYGGMGMYGAANGMGFGAPLGQQPQAAPSSGGAPGLTAGAGIYGAPAAAGGADNKDQQGAQQGQQQGGQPGGVPPAPGMQQGMGMYGMPPMWNQNPYGQPHVGQGYGYGGYQQGMYGQQFQAPGFGGYGQPYQQQGDDQHHHGGHNNQGGRGGYRGNRGRNNHGGYHNQNQYNQQQYGYQQPNMCKFCDGKSSRVV